MVTIPGGIAQAPQPLPRDLPEGRLRLRGRSVVSLGRQFGGLNSEIVGQHRQFSKNWAMLKP